MFAVTFLTEDGPELVLEYFFFKKYFVSKEAWYLILKDVIIGIVAVVSLVKEVMTCCNYNSSWAIVTIFNLSVGSLMLARLGAAMHQYFTGKLHRTCFKVAGGALVQTPFSSGCLKESDYVVISLLGLSGLLIALPIFSCIIYTAYVCGRIQKND